MYVHIHVHVYDANPCSVSVGLYGPWNLDFDASMCSGAPHQNANQQYGSGGRDGLLQAYITYIVDYINYLVFLDIINFNLQVNPLSPTKSPECTCTPQPPIRTRKLGARSCSCASKGVVPIAYYPKQLRQ